MRISTSPEFFERIANDPRIHPVISQSGWGPVSLKEVWDQIIGIEFGRGGWLFHDIGGGTYEVHTLFLPRSRGIRESAAATRHWIFCNTDSLELVTKVPGDNPSARRLAIDTGFTLRFTRARAWKRDAGPVDVDYLGMTIDEWITREPVVRKIGEEFHRKLHEQTGSAPDHEDDPVHDAYVGFALACAEYQNYSKGLRIYNRWATFAGYAPGFVLAPNRFQFGNIIVTFNNGEPEIAHAA